MKKRKEHDPDAVCSKMFVLQYLIEHAGMTVSREQLLIDVWGYNGKIFTRTIDVHIASLRQKLESDPKRPTLIQTVPSSRTAST